MRGGEGERMRGGEGERMRVECEGRFVPATAEHRSSTTQDRAVR